MNHEDIVSNIEARMEGAEAPVTDECCIYRVPFPIRRVNEDAYTPVVVSIGPFHHNRHPHLHNMERIKLTSCKSFLAKTQTTADTWVRYLREVEPNIRRCYSENLEFTQEELVQIVFVDSGFILYLFLRRYNRDWIQDDNSLLLTPLLRSSISKDLFLLENQIPFFVLDHLFNLSNSRFENDISFLQLTFRYFAYYNRSKLNFHNSSLNIRHFTDLLRTFHLQHPPQRRPPRTKELLRHLPSATELSNAGVRFRVNAQSHCLLDLTFSEGVLQIPRFEVHGRTEVLVRNMVALEQCHYPYESYIRDYMFVLDFLVNTSKDVDILVQQEVMENWLGDTHSVANMINTLLKNTVQAKFNSHYFSLCQDVNAFYLNPWRNLKSTLRHDYCKNPWQTAASFAAILLLFLTLVQTVCSVWQTIKQ